MDHASCIIISRGLSAANHYKYLLLRLLPTCPTLANPTRPPLRSDPKEFLVVLRDGAVGARDEDIAAASAKMGDETEDDAVLSEEKVGAMLVAELKAELKNRDLPVGGKKADLVERLLEVVKVEAEAAAAAAAATAAAATSAAVDFLDPLGSKFLDPSEAPPAAQAAAAAYAMREAEQAGSTSGPYLR